MQVLIASLKKWNQKNFKTLQKIYPEINFYFIDKREDLTLKNLAKIKPRYIFFPHWSFIIPKEIYEKYECVVFHMSDLPFGRGGSPLQNLILRGVKKTKICALKASAELDGGDIYLKLPLNISKRNAEKIYKKASKIIFFKAIPYILKNAPNLIPQENEAVYFARRKPEESDLNTIEEANLKKIYDFIRMLDAPSYPRAFLEFKDLKIIFKKAKLKHNVLKGEFEIVRK